MADNSRRKEFKYNVDPPSESSDPARRSVLKIGAAAVIAGIVAGAGGFYGGLASAPPAATMTTTKTETVTATRTVTETPAPTVEKPFAGQTCKWLGPSFMIDDNMVTALEEQTGVDIEETVTDLDTIRSRMLTGGEKIYDMMGADSAVWLALKPHANVTKRFPPEKIPRWVKWYPYYMSDIWTKPETVIGTEIPPPLGPSGPYLAESVIHPHIWAETPGVEHPEDDYGLKGEMLHLAPLCWNYDACLFNSKLLPEETEKLGETVPGTVRSSWSIMYDRKYKGHSCLLDSVATVTNHVAMYLIVNKMMDMPDVGANELTPKEVNNVIDFLIEQKKEGQFRVTWSDFMQLVNLYLTEEIWVGDAWQPVEYPVRAGGCPTFYIEPREGYRNWMEGNAPTGGTTKDELVYHIIDWQYGPWFSVYVQINSYYVPFYKAKEIIDAYGPERYGWIYDGTPTYKGFKPEEQALFAPQAYDWSMETGDPDRKNGNYKEGAGVDRKSSLVGVWGRFPHNADAYFDAWSRFRTA